MIQLKLNMASPALLVIYLVVLTTDYTWASHLCRFNQQVLFLDCSALRLPSVPTKEMHFNEAKQIDLSFNDISTIRDLTFSNVSHLRLLDLSHNSISLLQLKAFQTLSSLQVLNLSYNAIHLSLSDLTPQMFEPLNNLQLLRFQECTNSANIWEGVDAAFSQLKNLKTLFLDLPMEFVFGSGFGDLKKLTTISTSGRQRISNSSNIMTLRNETFAVFRDIALKELHLINCGITTIESGAFEPLKSLVTLDLSNNFGLGLSAAIQSLHSFEGQIMNVIKLSRMHGAWCKTTNQFTLLTKDVLLLGKLCVKSLDLSENFINYVEPLPIQIFELFSCLENFNMSYHSLRCVPTLLIQNTYIPQNWNIKSIDISNGNSVPSVAGNIYVEYTSPDFHRGLEFILPNLTIWSSLKQLNLRGLGYWFYLGAPIEVKNGWNLTYLNLGNNYLRNCNDSIIRGLGNLTELDVSGILCKNLHPDYFKAFPSLTSLSLSYSPHMDEALRSPTDGLPFSRLASLEDVDLSGNKLTDVHPELFFKNKVLRSINFANNKLQRLPRALWEVRNLRQLDLSSNAFTHFRPEEMTLLDSWIFKKGDENSFNLLLKKNPLQCTCDTVQFIRWLLEKETFLDIKNGFQCVLSNGTLEDVHKFGEGLKNFEVKCVSQTYLIIAVVGSLTLLLLILLFAAIYRYRLNLQYWLHTRLQPPERMFSNQEYNYDAFVAYTSDDYDWIRTDLCPNLESDRFGNPVRLCVHNRDFIPGKSILRNIVSHLKKSKRVLFITSRAFLQSTYGPQEIEYAGMKCLEEGREDVIVCVLMEDIAFREMPKALRILWNKITFLKWWEYCEREDFFWRKLKEALK